MGDRAAVVSLFQDLVRRGLAHNFTVVDKDSLLFTKTAEARVLLREISDSLRRAGFSDSVRTQVTKKMRHFLLASKNANLVAQYALFDVGWLYSYEYSLVVERCEDNGILWNVTYKTWHIRACKYKSIVVQADGVILFVQVNPLTGSQKKAIKEAIETISSEHPALSEQFRTSLF
ncbi:hypothetical protein Pelo_12976 [Pelomyxa schiedti]|nr:hypothetical protein Pelo_12976 [Pelomyxa schiedti]